MVKSNMTEVQSVIECDDFEEKKFDIMKGFVDHGSDSSGFTMFPKYKYDSGEDTLSFITGEIELCYGGIPKTDDKYRKTDDACLYFWVPLSARNGVKNKGGISLYNALSKIDKITKKSINSRTDFLKVIDKSGKSVVKTKKNLAYTPCVREYTPGAGNEDDEDEEKSDDDEDDKKEKFWRLKAKIDIESKWDSTAKKYDAEKKTKIKTVVSLLDKHGKIKPKPEKLSVLDDMRRFVTFGSTVIMQLDLVKTFLSRGAIGAGKEKMIIHTFVVKQIVVIKQGSGGANKIVSSSVFQGYPIGKAADNSDDDSDDVSDDEKSKKKNKKKSKKDSDDESDDDSDDDSKKKKLVKKSKKDSDDSDDSDDDNKKKKLVKKSKKNSDSEDDDDDSKKKKLVKKSKKNSDSEDDDDDDEDSDE